MGLIKNRTPYSGNIFLKFEKYPHYKDKKSKLNSVILNLGFTKLVSRMYPHKSFDGWEINKERLAKICMYTGGTIKTHEWWEVKGPNGIFKTNRKPKNPKDIIYHGKLYNSFMYGDTYIGDIETGWWYYKNRLVVCEQYPKGVAIKIKKAYWNGDREYLDSVEGAYGFSHRGGCLFRIGDRLFEEDYHPHVKDYTKEQWKVWHDKYRNELRKADGLDRKYLCEDGVAGFVPFNMRGKKIIETFDEAIQAANNLSKYLS
jgi:hypothetical protein